MFRLRRLGIASLATVALALLSLPSLAAGEEPAAELTVTVKKGDTLVEIAARNSVKVDDLRRWNRRTIGKGDSIRVGDTLVIKKAGASPQKESARSAEVGPPQPKVKPVVIPVPPGMWEDFVVIRKGDSLVRIAKRAEVDLEDLLAWNGFPASSHKAQKPPKIRAGQMLRVFRPGSRPSAKSIGTVTNGRLEYGRHLGEGEGYRLRFPRNAYGVEGVLKTLRTCAKRVRDNLPGSHDILIGDLSRPGGGRFPPHQGHQNGREADVGYYLASMKQNATMHRVSPEEVDIPRTWALMKCFITADEVVRMYVDRGIQSRMVEWLRARRVIAERDIARLFEVAGDKDSLVRHARKHDTHIHVRFACDEGQQECVEDEDDFVFEL